MYSVRANSSFLQQFMFDFYTIAPMEQHVHYCAWCNKIKNLSRDLSGLPWSVGKTCAHLTYKVFTKTLKSFWEVSQVIIISGILTTQQF